MQKKLFLIKIVMIVILLLSFNQGMSFTLNGEAELVAKLTGPEAINDTLRYKIYGTDLGHIFNYMDKFYYVFGDTFWKEEKLWRSNVMAVSSDTDPSDGIVFDYFIAEERSDNLNLESVGLVAKELIAEKDGDVTAIPTNGIAANGRMYLFFMSVNEWGNPGTWKTSYSGVAVSDDSGWNWEKLKNLKWSGDSNFAQVAIATAGVPGICEENPYINEGDIYFWGIPAGRFGPVKLMKVENDYIEDISSYRYYSGIDRNGIPVWSPLEKDAVEIIKAPVGECSIIYNEYLGKWIFSYLNEKSHNLEIRESREPWGPWSEPTMLVDHKSFPGLYGAYMHPLLVMEKGRIIYFTMSLWKPYNVYLMKVVLGK